LYQSSNSRLLTINHRTLQFLPFFSFCWFLLCIANRGGPFSLRLAREVVSIRAIVRISWIFYFPVFFIALVSCGYRVILYIFTQHKSESYLKKNYDMNLVGLTNLLAHVWFRYLRVVLIFLYL
jgi:hypothetical protein